MTLKSSRSSFSVPFAAFLLSCANLVSAQEQDVKRLKALSIEDLMNIEVTSVAKVPVKLTEAASAVQVITRGDILRSGATSIPEALRLASNLQVAQLSSSAWIISARGFNTVFANKLLVLIDGRTVYTPLFGGVLWELQSVLLEDVERIEVISGPGATLWGANAVNGVINIITRKAKDSQGLYASASAGDFLRNAFAARYGGKINDKTFYRVYAQHNDRNSTVLADGNDNTDAWKISQAGFNIGMAPTEKDRLTIQGDAYAGTNSTASNHNTFDGQNLLTRWNRTFTDHSDFTAQVYFDRYWRDDAGTADELKTFDIDLQYHLRLKNTHNFLFGVGYRYVHDDVTNRTDFAGLLPPARTMPLYSAFVQDELTLHEKFKVTLGSKILHNVFTGVEIQPSVRAAWSILRNNTLWAAVSHAVRAPSRFDVDYFLPLEPQPPTVPSVAGGPNFVSEKLNAYELGYKIQPSSKLSLSLATFYNKYNDIYSVETIPNALTLQIQNGSEGETWGAELSGFYQVSKSWRLRGGFTYFDKDIHAKEGRMHDPGYLANDVKHHFVLQSMFDLPAHFKFDVVARYLDYIPASFATARVPEYFTFDTRIAWEYKAIEISFVGQNLWKEDHSEFGSFRIPRSFYGKVACRL